VVGPKEEVEFEIEVGIDGLIVNGVDVVNVVVSKEELKIELWIDVSSVDDDVEVINGSEAGLTIDSSNLYSRDPQPRES
jgi:hypothetical protein